MRSDAAALARSAGVSLAAPESASFVPADDESCPICFGAMEGAFALRCGHGFCHECWVGHLSHLVGSNQAAVRARCPMDDCHEPVGEDVFYRCVVGCAEAAGSCRWSCCGVLSGSC